VGGGTTAPYVFTRWSPVLGALLALALVVSVPLMMVKLSLSQMDEAQVRQWGTFAVISNAVLGILFAIGWMLAAYQILLTSDMPETTVRILLVIGLGMILVGPLIYWLRGGREVRFVEGTVKVTAEGFGPRREIWTSELGFISNVSILAAVVARNLIQGRGVGKRSEDFKFVRSHSITVGKRKFYTTTEIGKSFVDGARYRVYYASAYPLPLLVSGEALD